MSTNLHRRQWLKNSIAILLLIPVVSTVRSARANTNTALRTQFKYQNVPLEDKSCITCLEFIPGKTDKDLGGCKVLPGDDEVSPNGYCLRWNTM